MSIKQILLVAVCFFILYLVISLDKSKEEKNWFLETEKSRGIDVNDIKIKLHSFTKEYIYFLYMNDERLFFVNCKSKEIVEINKNEILKVDFNVQVEYKGKLTYISYYDINIKGKEKNAIFKVITEDKTYEIVSQSNPDFKEKAIRLKAILDKQIKR